MSLTVPNTARNGAVTHTLQHNVRLWVGCSLQNSVPDLNDQAKGERRIGIRISKHDKKVLTEVKIRARLLDAGLFSCCGIEFGWSSVIGFIPV
jgi:hypothetical protein